MSLRISRRVFGKIFIGSALAPTFITPVWADDGATAYVQKLGGEVITLANAGTRGDKGLQRRFAALFTRYISIPSVANFALGTAQRQLPAGDKAMFYDLVANYAAALFVWYVDDFKGQTMSITAAAEQGRFTIVDSAIKSGGLGGEKLRWRVSGSKGNYRVADLNVKGVWLGISMKKLFADTLKNSDGDFNALYAKLREAERW